ncbi:hypothetical protein Goari_005912 [Gossypium aridum]|uniref:Uncharacterized protein n=1 Tax=Gossypium aridum TaxID=34290 RepID=A0A7J8XLH2_GOSAI|nr:hypothetical protein [Gossypium aridum]
MQSLEENNRQMMETVSKLAYSSSTQQIQLVNEDENTCDRTNLLDVNTKNGNNIPTNPFSSGNTNVANPLVTITRVTLTIPGAFIGVVSTSTPWSQMCRMFGEKFFSTQEKVTLIDLGREHY